MDPSDLPVDQITLEPSASFLSDVPMTGLQNPRPGVCLHSRSRGVLASSACLPFRHWSGASATAGYRPFRQARRRQQAQKSSEFSCEISIRLKQTKTLRFSEYSAVRCSPVNCFTPLDFYLPAPDGSTRRRLLPIPAIRSRGRATRTGKHGRVSVAGGM